MVKTPLTSAFAASLFQRRGMVTLHGHTSLTPSFRMRHTQIIHEVDDRPPDPQSLLSPDQLQEQVERLVDWWQDKNRVLCMTGAGLSTESGIPDYRGSEGSYHRGHKPMVHDQFMKSEYQRKRYWGRGMVGWKSFHETSPNAGHLALADLERMGRLGVSFEDQADFYDDCDNDLEWTFSSGQRRVAVITQNVDMLHRRAGSKHLIELHGRTDQLKCMECGSARHRDCFHEELTTLNKDWLVAALEKTEEDAMRPDGDANVQTDDYQTIQIPPCKECGGFMKPDVVFFGDTVPKTRVAQCRAAVDNADGILVVGSSLAVHSAYRHIRAANQKGIPIAVLNVGETRAEKEGLDVLKIEAPAGSTLGGVAAFFATEQQERLAVE